jgi:[ribosomal protein S5]-alanine N-acetyltransferase
VPELQRLRADHAPAVLAFELANRVYFAASISDRGDEFYDRFTERHSALLAEQEAGIGAFYVLVAEDGSVLGRFNLVFAEDGTAKLGYRVAQHVAGRGVATATVREMCGLAAAQYGLRTLKAATSYENAASQKVLARAGFIPVGPADPADLGGKQGTWYQRDLVQPLSSSLLVRSYAVSRSCGLGEVLLPGVAFEVAGVAGIGVVAPLVRMRGLVVPDRELGDAGAVVHDQVDAQARGIDWSSISRKLIKVTESPPRIRLAIISPVATFIAAMIETVPCRLYPNSLVICEPRSTLTAARLCHAVSSACRP